MQTIEIPGFYPILANRNINDGPRGSAYLCTYQNIRRINPRVPKEEILWSLFRNRKRIQNPPFFRIKALKEPNFQLRGNIASINEEEDEESPGLRFASQ